MASGESSQDVSRHAKQSDDSAVACYRDSMAWPVRELGRVLRRLDDQQLDADPTRSGTSAGLGDMAAADVLPDATRLILEE